MNSKAESLLGWKENELLGKNLHELVHSRNFLPPCRGGDHCRLTSGLKSMQLTRVHDDVFVAKDGRMVAVSYTLSPLILRGDFRAMILVFRELVHNGRVVRGGEGLIPLQASSSDDRASRRILEEQLLQSQKMEAIGQLAGGVAHDFNNLLTAINGYSELILQNLRPDDPLWTDLSEIRNAGERAGKLTRQLLAFSRKQILQPEVLDLNSIVVEMEKMLRRLIGENIALRTSLAPELGRIQADPGQVEQVIMNLAVNARDAMRGGGVLSIKTQGVELGDEYADQHVSVKPGAYIMMAVSDTGCGMDESTRNRIFEPFFTTKGTRGTGLGLSTVYGIVQQSCGHIWVYTEPGHGTTFKIYFPLVVKEDRPHKRAAVRPETCRGTETILLAEDEDALRKFVREVLAKQGYNVLEATNGSSALTVCQGYPAPIDLLISDIIMPEVGGNELAAQLSSRRPSMKVLYMSGYTDDTLVDRGVLSPEISFLPKPFTPHELVRMVREVLDSGE